jgi:adenine phosphoribosyltransferase
MLETRVRALIRTIPDFPKPGIQFKDISPLLTSPEVLNQVVGWVADNPDFTDAVDVVVALDARGFLFGVPIALDMGVPFVMCRKAGKLPGTCISHSYALEYGNATVEMQLDAFPEGSQVMLIDDLLATGGTMAAAVHLVRYLGGVVKEAVFITELADLGGRAKLEALDVPVRSLVTY